MNRKLKSFASNLMLVTGIITSIAGVIETVGKLVLSFRTKTIPEVKSLRIPEYGDLPMAPTIGITDVSFFTEYRGVILIVAGVLVIGFSLFVIKRLKR